MPRAPVVVVLASAFLGACGSSDAGPTERLWISGVPTSAKQSISAFVTTRTSGDKYIGAFFQGSALRGSHDVFEWQTDGKDGAKLRFLQDDTQLRVRFETCKPTKGFDFCLLVRSGSSENTYYSRKRWNVRRPKKKDLEAVHVPSLLGELAEDDAELAAALELSPDAP